MEHAILFSEAALSFLSIGESRAVRFLSKLIGSAQEGTGFFMSEEMLPCLLESGFVLKINRVEDYRGEAKEFDKLYILNPEHIWKGESWMRGVFDIELGAIKFLRAWLPVCDLFTGKLLSVAL